MVVENSFLNSCFEQESYYVKKTKKKNKNLLKGLNHFVTNS